MHRPTCIREFSSAHGLACVRHVHRYVCGRPPTERCRAIVGHMPPPPRWPCRVHPHGVCTDMCVDMYVGLRMDLCMDGNTVVMINRLSQKLICDHGRPAPSAGSGCQPTSATPTASRSCTACIAVSLQVAHAHAHTSARRHARTHARTRTRTHAPTHAHTQVLGCRHRRGSLGSMHA